ncbi:MAG: hypothetical protein WKF82_03230 [Nocardioidaceae bacterium]
MEVDLRRFDADVAQPERDDAGVDAGVEESHRGGVSQHVRGDRLVARARGNSRWPRRRSGRSGVRWRLGSGAVRGGWGTAALSGRRRARRASPVSTVRVSVVSGVDPFLAALAVTHDVRAGAEVQRRRG